MRVIGHRGTPTGPLHTENTLPAVVAALEAGADGVEVDVRSTADGVLVLAHDADLGRVLGTGTGTGPVVAETGFAALRALRLPGGAHVPSLDEVLDLAAASRALVVTEVKAGLGSRRARTAVLLGEHLEGRRRRRPGANRVVTSSFDTLSARILAGPGTVGGAVILEPWQDPLRMAGWARRCGLTELHLSVEHVRRDPGVVSDLHAMGLEVAAGIVDAPEEAARMVRLGVDLLCTDAVARVGRARTVRTGPDRAGGLTGELIGTAASRHRSGDPGESARRQSVAGGSSRGMNTSSIGRGPTYCRQVHGTHWCPDQRPRLS
jgi:glycerophosphoryl diester phosphodiesterase